MCPQCRGVREIRIAPVDGRNTMVKRCRCDMCTEGNQINPAKEAKAIERWIRKHVPDAAQAHLEVVK